MGEVILALEAVRAGQALPSARHPRRIRALAGVTLAAFAAFLVVGVALRHAAAPTARVASATPPRGAGPTVVPAPGATPVAPAAASAAVPASVASSPAPRAASVAAAPAAVASPVAVRPARIPVEVRSTPAGARVSLHGRMLGITPLTVHLPEGVPLLLVFEAEGRLSIAERVRARPGLALAVQLPPSAPTPSLDDLKASPYQR